MQPREADRTLAWLRAVAADRAERQVAVPGGVAFLHGRYPAAHDHNHLLLWSEVDPDAAADAADTVLGGAGLNHRLIHVHGADLAAALDAGLRERGYERSTSLLMVHRGAVPPVGPVRVEDLDVAERAEVASAGWRDDHPDWEAAVSTQLGERIRTILDAVDATFLGVRDDSRRVMAHADLYVRAGIAQVEEVITLPAARNRGLARALVADAVRRAHAAGASLVFLLADADDWPAGLYRRLGFTELTRTASFTR